MWGSDLPVGDLNYTQMKGKGPISFARFSVLLGRKCFHQEKGDPTCLVGRTEIPAGLGSSRPGLVQPCSKCVVPMLLKVDASYLQCFCDMAL